MSLSVSIRDYHLLSVSIRVCFCSCPSVSAISKVIVNEVTPTSDCIPPKPTEWKFPWD